MRVTVAETQGRYRALVPDGAGVADCCEAGHATEDEAAAHALLLTQALARHETTGNAALQPARPSAARSAPR